jgi:hypothetical protein
MISLVALFPLFLIRAFGGGDIKLTALLVGYLGVNKAIDCMLLALIVAAIISLIKLIKAKQLFIRLQYFLVYIRQIFQEKKFTYYYIKERDGYSNTICFSIPIGIAYFIMYMYQYMGGI